MLGRSEPATIEGELVTMTAAENELMHGDHRFWESEISLWRDDLRIWQHELAISQDELKQLAKALEDHALRLRMHASSLRLDEIAFDGHEHAIAELEKKGISGEMPNSSLEHQQESDRHIAHRKAHESLKRKHHQVIAHWNLLLKALQQPTC
jgi:hypothetical protein